MPGTLHDDILAIPGIDDAELEGDAASPAGVRVRLSYGADPQRVGREVRRVLALHGMRSLLTEVPDQVAPAEPPPPPPPSGTVVNLSDYENDAASATPAAEASEPDVPADIIDAEPLESVAAIETLEEQPALAGAGAGGDGIDAEVVEPGEQVEGEAAADEAAPDEVVTDAGFETASSPEAGTALAILGNVAVIEGAGGVTVTASTRLGKTKSRTAPVSAGGVDRAIISAVSRLLAPDQDPPMLVEIIDSDRDGELILTVILELDTGRHAVGSAIQAANRPWAVARATRAALSAPE